MQGVLLPNAKRAKWAIITTWSMLVLMPILYFMIYIINPIMADSGLLLILIDLLLGLALIACMVVFLMWFYRAYSNLHNKTDALAYKASWAIWSWFIPIVNFYVPYKIIKELYVKTSELIEDSPAKENLQNFFVINFLWTLYIALWILDIVYFVAIFPDDSIAFDVLTFILTIPSVWTTVQAISRYSAAEKQLFNENLNSLKQ